MPEHDIPPEAVPAFLDDPSKYDELFTREHELKEDTFELTQEYEGYANPESPFYIENEELRKQAREELRDDNSAWVADLRRIDAIEFLPDLQVENYVEWYTSKELRRPEDWADTLPWYEDDWWKQEHEEFVKLMVDSGKWKQPVFVNVPTREVFDLYLEWQRTELGKARREFEAANPELDKWLHDKFGTILETDRAKEPPLDDEEEFIPSVESVKSLVDDFGFSKSQAKLALSYTAYVDFTHQGNKVDTEAKMLALIGQMVNEFTPVEILDELEKSWQGEKYKPLPSKEEIARLNKLALAEAPKKLILARERWIEDWAVPKEEAEVWVDYPTSTKIIPDGRAFYIGIKGEGRKPAVGYITLDARNLNPGSLAHEIAHANYYEEIPSEMRNIYPYVHYLAQAISPEYRRAVRYGSEEIEVFPGLKVDRGKFPTEGYSLAYQRLAKTPEGIPWYLEPFYGNLMYKVPEDVKEPLGWLAQWFRWKLEEAFGNVK